VTPDDPTELNACFDHHVTTHEGHFMGSGQLAKRVAS
jgi:hypothetical protein